MRPQVGDITFPITEYIGSQASTKPLRPKGPKGLPAFRDIVGAYKCTYTMLMAQWSHAAPRMRHQEMDDTTDSVGNYLDTVMDPASRQQRSQSQNQELCFAYKRLTELYAECSALLLEKHANEAACALNRDPTHELSSEDNASSCFDLLHIINSLRYVLQCGYPAMQKIAHRELQQAVVDFVSHDIREPIRKAAKRSSGIAQASAKILIAEWLMAPCTVYNDAARRVLGAWGRGDLYAELEAEAENVVQQVLGMCSHHIVGRFVLSANQDMKLHGASITFDGFTPTMIPHTEQVLSVIDCKIASVIGRDVPLGDIVSEKCSSLLKSLLENVFSTLDSSEDLDYMSKFKDKVQLLRRAHAQLSSRTAVPEWADLLSQVNQDDSDGFEVTINKDDIQFLQDLVGTEGIAFILTVLSTYIGTKMIGVSDSAGEAGEFDLSTDLEKQMQRKEEAALRAMNGALFSICCDPEALEGDDREAMLWGISCMLMFLNNNKAFSSSLLTSLHKICKQQHPVTVNAHHEKTRKDWMGMLRKSPAETPAAVDAKGYQVAFGSASLILKQAAGGSALQAAAA
eukprot:gene4229-767_t